MENSTVAGLFRDIAQILQIKGENTFRIRAYERAAQNIEAFSEDVKKLAEEGRLKEIPGIGGDLADKISEIIKTGKLRSYEELKKSIPAGLIELLNIPSVGPKTARHLYEQLNIKGIPDLERAIEEHKLDRLPGIKEKTIHNIQRGIQILKSGQERMPLAYADAAAREFIDALSALAFVKSLSLTGSLRRRKETVRDIDMLAVSKEPEKVMDVFTGAPDVKEVLARGKTKSSVRTAEGIQVDLRVVEPGSFGAAMVYFTGSKGFNIKLRAMAQKKGWKINEYGVFSGDKYIAGRSEKEVFKALGLSYIEPELREDTGELELALKGKLPRLIEMGDLKGDLHVHSRWSDGNDTIEEITGAARSKGYSYIAIADHSVGLRVAGGLGLAELKKKKAQIDKINKKLKGLRLLYGTEVEIGPEGDIDYKDEVLKDFDIVVGAIHSGFKQSKAQLTKRIIRACRNKYVNIIAHPRGRLWGVREPYELDFDQVLKAAADTNTALEINSYTQRLDLNDVYSRRAKEEGVKLSIDSDSHNLAQLDMIRLGVDVARRAGLGKEDVINTLPLEQLLKAIKK
ncbi:MAG: DNA polymerase/3'-5' exonuclease PolX [Candidatus Omnitrophica bacterium]|nr:DNA polymerase/3'-5' exonuclease PolX [Candidatus Omnitrophota bacterium]